ARAGVPVSPAAPGRRAASAPRGPQLILRVALARRPAARRCKIQFTVARRAGTRRMIATVSVPFSRARPRTQIQEMKKARRRNYNSGEDFVLEYGELRFTFNEQDFAERCEQAALALAFVGGRLGEQEREDLVNLAVNGEILEPASALGEHVKACWPELIGPAEPSLGHWPRRA